jgi:hypothetical protein
MLQSALESFANVEAWMLALAPVALLTYFLPVLIGYARHHRYSSLIGALNLVIGWTGLGWLACLLWAINRDIREFPERQPVHERPDLPAQLLVPRLPETRGDFSAPSQRPLAAAPASATEHKKCPHCRQPVRADAVACRSCGYSLRAPAAKPAPVAPVRELERREPRVFPEIKREAAVRSLDQTRREPQNPPRHAALGKSRTQADDGDWRYDARGSGDRRHQGKV